MLLQQDSLGEQQLLAVDLYKHLTPVPVHSLFAGSSRGGCCLLPSCGAKMKTLVCGPRLVCHKLAQVAMGKYVVLPVQFMRQTGLASPVL